VTVNDMKVLDSLPCRLPGKGKGVSVETGKPAEGNLDPVMHVFLDRTFEGQNFGFFRL
jgi:hypothetical protein